jgi:hypothetical protein
LIDSSGHVQLEAYQRKCCYVTALGRIAAFIFVAMVSLLIALRPMGLDKDYQNYLEYYNSILSGTPVEVEFGYRIFSWLFDFVGLGFVGVLYIYAFIALYGKFKFFQRIQNGRPTEYLFFGLLYFLTFFPLWELTQIRNAAAVAVASLAILEIKKSRAILYFFVAVLLHNVSFMMFGLWLVQRYFGSVKYLVVAGGVILVYLGLEFMPYYQVYAADIYLEKFNPFSLKVLFIVATFVYLQFCSQSLAKRLSYYSIGLLLFYFAMGRMPAAAVRIADISLFFSVLGLSLAHLNLSWLYKLATLLALGYVFTSISYFGESPLINLDTIFMAG